MKSSNIFTSKCELKCAYCGKDLLENTGLSMVQIITDKNGNIVQVNPCCKGVCDKQLLKKLPMDCEDGWKELREFTNPYLYLKHLMAILNTVYEGHKFTNVEAFENYKDILINTAPYVMRDLTDGEKENAQFDDAFPF